MKCEIVKLFFKSPLHLGEKEGMMEDSNFIIHSDTLFSGLCYAYRTLYGKDALETLLEQFKNSPPFLLSSAFPFYKGCLLFPIPLNFRPPEEDVKSYKKLQLIPKELWEKVCSDKALRKDGYEFVQDKKVFLPKNWVRILSEREKEYPIWEEREIQRVSLDSITSSSNLFNFREVVFKKDSGLFFLLDWRNTSFANRIKAAIRLLGEEGIGGDRGSGKGVFNPEFGELEISDLKGDDYLLLSLFFPSKAEIQGFDGIYNFKMRGGFVYSFDNTTRRKKYVRMLTEGSVIKGERPLGSLENITPDGFTEHNVYRYGYAFSMLIGG
ncbi:MAG: type III-A CRISPR-associated RAMP protein Csm4 [Deltaproteobacteria bacterium]|nr:type III-A CRISPR-associated RAMP protein Csm4 [Deltaproteobacteria bacterium]